MQRIPLRGAFLSLGVLLFVSSASAQMLGTSARQLPAGSLKLLTYYQGVQGQTVRFNVRGTGGCTTAAPSNLSFGCDQAGEIDADGSGGMGVVKLIYQPWDYLQYYGTVGVGDYTLRVPSTTVTNALTGDNPGIQTTFGLRATIYPDTIVTPGIAVDASISRSQYDFNRVYPGGAPGQTGSVNQTLSFWQYQVAVETSHQFVVEEKYKLEPYGGLKWVRTASDLHDHQDGTHAGGQLDSVTPFIGLRVPATEHEALFAEASFIDGYQYAAGLELRFK